MEEIVEDYYNDQKIDMLYILEEEYKLQQFLNQQNELLWDLI